MIGLTVVAIPRAVANTSVAPALPNSIAAIADAISVAFDDCCHYGNHPNDVCTSSTATMTPTAIFQSEFQTAMSRLKAGLPARTHILVSSISNIYRLW
jgi:hypothetical protein